MTDYTIQFLLMELESVGNIRLEEGCPTDRWYRTLISFIMCLHMPTAHMRLSFVFSNRFTSCCDLLLSRFHQSDFAGHGISGIKINRVVRINNTALRLRFEDKYDSLCTTNTGLAQ